jgi:hypothetical protein
MTNGLYHRTVVFILSFFKVHRPRCVWYAKEVRCKSQQNFYRTWVLTYILLLLRTKHNGGDAP